MSADKMREEFEAEWGIEMNPGVYFVPELNVYGAELYAHYEYATQKSSAWFYFQKGWQVSRAALVIDLPEAWRSAGSTHELMHKKQTVAAIEAAGIRVQS